MTAPSPGGARDPNLDLVRALAIAMVMVSHLPHVFPNQAALGQGVDVFFVLSGFLISRIFLRQEEQGFRLLRFWSDRWLRTLPAYYFVLLGGLVLGALVKHPWRVADFDGKLWEYLIFIQNYDAVSPQRLGPFPISWSLCVEEQFYFCLPLVLLVVRSRPGRFLFVAGVIVTALAVRWPGMADWERSWFMTHVRFDGIGFGILTALATDWRPAWVERLRPWSRPLAAAWLALILARCFGWPARADYVALLNASTALVIASSAGALPLPGALSHWARWGATLSYALYLVHDNSYRHLRGFWNGTALRLLPEALKWPFVLIVTCAIALGLHLVVEKPGLALRERVRRRLAQAPPPVESATIA